MLSGDEATACYENETDWYAQARELDVESGWRENALVDLKALLKSRYKAAESAKVGTTIHCPTCNKKHLKRTYQQKFCCIKHKDEYWNTVDDNRRARAVIYNG